MTLGSRTLGTNESDRELYFKHKYITQPMLMPTEVLLRKGNSSTKIAVDLLMDIFKGKVKDEQTIVDL